MPDYTEAAIRELTGRELRVAVSLLVLGDDLTANTEGRLETAVCEAISKLAVTYTDFDDGEDFIDWRKFWHARHGLGGCGRTMWADDLEQHVANWRAEPLPMPLDWCEGLLNEQLSGWYWNVGRCQLGMMARLWRDSSRIPLRREFVQETGPDMRTAILRVSCIVKLREGA